MEKYDKLNQLLFDLYRWIKTDYIEVKRLNFLCGKLT
jgi:hypothetical protein